jgi:hypothetical protein
MGKRHHLLGPNHIGILSRLLRQQPSEIQGYSRATETSAPRCCGEGGDADVGMRDCVGRRIIDPHIKLMTSACQGPRNSKNRNALSKQVHVVKDVGTPTLITPSRDIK